VEWIEGNGRAGTANPPPKYNPGRHIEIPHRPHSSTALTVQIRHRTVLYGTIQCDGVGAVRTVRWPWPTIDDRASSVRSLRVGLYVFAERA